MSNFNALATSYGASSGVLNINLGDVTRMSPPKLMEESAAHRLMVGSRVILNLCQTINQNCIVAGMSGSGKTMFMRHLIKSVASSTSALIVDFHGDLRDQSIPSIKIGGAEGYVLQPLLPSNEQLEVRSLAEYVEFIVPLLFERKLGSQQKSFFTSAIMRAYASKGLMPDSRHVDPHVTLSFEELIEELGFELQERRVKEQENASRPKASPHLTRIADTLVGRLETFAAFSAFNGGRILDVSQMINQSVHLDLSDVPTDMQGLVAVFILNEVGACLLNRGEVQAGQPPRLMLFLDEAKIVIDAERKGCGVLNELFSQRRKYGFGAAVATQNFNDLSRAGLVNNAAVIVALNNNRYQAHTIKRACGFDTPSISDSAVLHGSVKISNKSNTVIADYVRFKGVERSFLANHKITAPYVTAPVPSYPGHSTWDHDYVERVEREEPNNGC